MLNEKEIDKLFGAVLGALASRDAGDEFLSAKEFYTAALATGLDMTAADPERRAPTLKAIQNSYRQLIDKEKYQVLVRLTSTLMSNKNRAAKFNRVLNGFGYVWDESGILPLGLVDQAERKLLPSDAVTELAKAVDRLIRGDESGAISSACGAVDLCTGAVYAKHGFGDPGKVAFSPKVNTAVQKLGVFDAMQKEFLAIGLEQKDAKDASEHLEQAINHAGQALQILRKRMGDVHGTRPALKSTAYDCIKFASAICGLFQGYV